MSTVSLNPDQFNFDTLSAALKGCQDSDQLHHAIVNAPFAQHVATASLFLGIIVLLLVDEASQTIRRVALTDNDIAHRTKRGSVKPFHEISIPLNDQENAIAKAIKTGEPQYATDWYYLFTPALTAEQARMNQADGGITHSVVCPLRHTNGALIFSYYQFTSTPEQQDVMQRYTQLVSSLLN